MAAKKTAKLDAAISEALTLAGSLGLDLDDVRTILPGYEKVADEDVEQCLKRGQAVHRLNVSAKLYGIIESPQTVPKDLIAAERHLREIHTKETKASGAGELLALLRCTVPMVPPVGVICENEYEEEEE